MVDFQATIKSTEYRLFEKQYRGAECLDNVIQLGKADAQPKADEV